eukprot:TRINITY_DN5992_c0_g1_i2.p1 TRINITY_DN5992_c0_g1~~TRINITY_DN5992_c0_g1_i2.p1  ORF type:complete len:118 (+),score=5.11 TRINITY_DN5992_c0_g1_i2:97-450(+)
MYISQRHVVPAKVSMQLGMTGHQPTHHYFYFLDGITFGMIDMIFTVQLAATRKIIKYCTYVPADVPYDKSWPTFFKLLRSAHMIASLHLPFRFWPFIFLAIYISCRLCFLPWIFLAT